MIRIFYKTVLLGILLLFITVITSDAAVPVPSEVTEDIVEPQRTELKAQREELLIRRDSIKLNVAIHNAKCSKVKPGSSIVDECRANQQKLHSDITNYVGDVTAFNALVIEAPRTTDRAEPDALLSDNMIKYFLINRDENYTIHNAIMRDMIADAGAGRKWPGPKRDHARPVTPLDETQELRDKELLYPLDLHKISSLTLDQAAQIVNERQDARERESTRTASNRMHMEMKKLEEEGILRPGESVIQKEKNDPAFRKRLKGILTDITKEELAGVYNARSLALQEMEEIIEARAIDPSKKGTYDKTIKDIKGQRDSALERINSQSLKDMSEEMARLKQEGYYSEGDNLVEKDRTDPDFRNAVNEAVRNVLIRQYEAEHRVHQKALNELQSAAKKLLEK